MYRAVVCCAGRLSGKLLWTTNIAQYRLRLNDRLRQLQLNHDINIRTISLTAVKYDKKKKPTKNVKADDERESSPVSQEVEEAAVTAAKSLPGNWTRTADELLSRLQSMSKKETSESSHLTPPDADSMSLLSSMKVGRDFEASPRASRGSLKSRKKRSPSDGETDILPRSVQQTSIGERQPRKKDLLYGNLHGVPRLGIFPERKVSEVISVENTLTVSKGEGVQEDDLWAVVQKECLRKIQGGLPRNAFEEMIHLTDEGKVWTFPIDNEADLHEERKYKFHDHIFLERHLSGFPATGPVRKFMELVCLGLSQNSWLTVPEKLEHIAWFENYFREKQDVLETSLGLEGKMTESGELGEGK